MEKEQKIEIERERVREEIIQEAKGIIYKNLIESGLAEKIVAKSEHAEKPFSSEFYNDINLEYLMGENNFATGVWIAPRLSTNTDRYLQPVTLKLERLSYDKASRIKMVEDIWNGVTNEHKKAIFNEAVDYQISRHQNQLSSIVTMKNDGVNEERLQHLSKQWEQELIYLQNLKKSLMNSDYEEKFNFEYADIGVKPKEVTDKGK